MCRLSDKLLRRLIWVLLALALFFVGVAFYLPARAIYQNVPERIPTALVRQAAVFRHSKLASAQAVTELNHTQAL